MLYGKKLTGFDFEIDGHPSARSGSRKADGFANVRPRVLWLDVGHFETAIDVTGGWRQSQSASAGPTDGSSCRPFVSALEHHLTT